MSARELGVGVVGLGYAGGVHLAAWNALASRGSGCRVVAVADRDARKLASLAKVEGNLPPSATAGAPLDLARVRTTTDAGELLADPEVGLVVVATPTDAQAGLAERALLAGKHVLVEKPVSLDAAEIARLIERTRGSPGLCMPAFVMRFWPEWAWIAARVRDGSLGHATSASFQRLGSRPRWSPFYADASRSGGALHDLHVHDADFVLHCFGTPREVASTGSLDHVTTLYRFEGGPAHVVAEGGWDHAPGFGFRMRATVVFERATAEFDLAREPALLVSRGGRAEPVELARESAYELQARALLDAVQAGAERAPVTLEHALAASRLLEAERASLDTGRGVVLGG